MVYPAIIIFGMMAFSGFWLIYSLTDDVHELAMNVDPKMEHNLSLMAKNIARLTDSVESMTSEVKACVVMLQIWTHQCIRCREI